ncbi:hypothetical protein Palpr_1575 [Paludibacter propionicigenes WB4]|uniref:Uncharacterized protein n=1 Tax=Paludibacter propionicigenes (strain DSM 17365 / JCM 13257 / WB4) TaxID=694427 RepID=E4T4S6_PALPW|nr:hypothetical protein [Paludibacter propionicigenes]ADQ79720.1 hypothetical protein Palpr_1575 [Paludibacter propionicigenes WB4]
MKDCSNAIFIKTSAVSASFDKELFRAVRAFYSNKNIDTMNRVSIYLGFIRKAEQGHFNESQISTSLQEPYEFSEVSEQISKMMTHLGVTKNKKNNINFERRMD